MGSARFEFLSTVPEASDGQLEALEQFILRSGRVLVLTGAGCSTESGIPDYRSPGGIWKDHKPIQYQEFIRSLDKRRRYWARSMVGWRSFARAMPNGTHRALAWLEQQGLIDALVTQNVDRLHHAAGSQRVIELHGTNHLVRCLGCHHRLTREDMQVSLERLNAGWTGQAVAVAPDGDAALTTEDFSGFGVPDCPQCGGMLKPDVVFFGENVPRERVALAFDWLQQADALWVVGSSLTVYSGYRFAKAAAEAGKPVAVLNIGPTRADDLASLKLEARCGELVPRLVERLQT